MTTYLNKKRSPIPKVTQLTIAQKIPAELNESPAIGTTSISIFIFLTKAIMSPFPGF